MSGRPTKRTPDTRTVIVQALEEGLTRRAACGCADISEDTFARELVSNADFAEQVVRAEARGRAELERVIRESAIGYHAEETTTAEKSRWVNVPAKDAKGEPIQNADGTVVMVEERVTWTETTTASRYQRDTRLGLEILARRNPDEWGSGLDRQVRRLTDADIVALLMGAMAPPLVEGSGGEPLLLESGQEHGNGNTPDSG